MWDFYRILYFGTFDAVKYVRGGPLFLQLCEVWLCWWCKSVTVIHLKRDYHGTGAWTWTTHGRPVM